MYDYLLLKQGIEESELIFLFYMKISIDKNMNVVTLVTKVLQKKIKQISEMSLVLNECLKDGIFNLSSWKFKNLVR